MAFQPKKNIDGTKPRRRIWSTCFVLSPLIALLAIWIFAALYFLVLLEKIDESESESGSSNYNIVRDRQKQRIATSTRSDQHGRGIENAAHYDPVNDAPQSHRNQRQHDRRHRDHPQMMARSSLLSRNPNVTVTSSARGNLGPPSVLNQDPPGTDWIKDRWQAASDMHGTAIAGRHWVLLDFTGYLSSSSSDIEEEAETNHGDDGRVLHGGGASSSSSSSSSSAAAVYVTKIALDWETAYAKNYRVEGRFAPPPDVDDHDDGEWCVLYDGASDNNDDGNAIRKEGHANANGIVYPHRSVREYGQSPGVKQKLPLHIIHTIEWSEQVVVNDGRRGGNGGVTTTTTRENDNNKSKEGYAKNCHTLRYLRVFIRKPARGWGVSLWEVDVFGTVVG